jgi:hypothetical protein
VYFVCFFKTANDSTEILYCETGRRVWVIPIKDV